MPGRGVPGKGDNLSPEGSGLCGHLHRQGASGSSVPWEISQFLSDTAPLKAPGPEDPDPDTSVGPRLGRHKGGGCLTSSKNLAPRGISHPSCREQVRPRKKLPVTKLGYFKQPLDRFEFC